MVLAANQMRLEAIHVKAGKSIMNKLHSKGINQFEYDPSLHTSKAQKSLGQNIVEKITTLF
jgi:hypothetical protein